MPSLPISQKSRKTLNKIKDIKRRIEKSQKDYSVDSPMYVNSYFSALIELWTEGSEWEDIVEQINIGEGDIVRAFKRTVDVLRQFCTISDVPEALVFTARETIEKILRSPIDID